MTDFVDGEGCFIVSRTKNKKLKITWEVRLIFVIGLKEKDFSLLEKIKNFFFALGRFFIVKKKTKSYLFRVSSLKDFNVIINHFNQFSLITQKRADFKLFQQVYFIMLCGEHFTHDGLRKIVAIRASMNQGIKSSQILFAAFPDVVPVARPKVKNQKLHDPNSPPPPARPIIFFY